jgi:hypothetical protein
MPVSRQQPLFRKVAIALLVSIFGFLAQPQVDALYHVHRGGEHAHVHTRLLASPIAPHNDQHHPTHGSHHHPHAYTTHESHAHQHVAAHAKRRTTPVLRHVHSHSNGHWHATFAMHWARPITASPLLPNFPTHQIQEVAAVTILSAPFFTVRSRAPPSSF